MCSGKVVGESKTCDRKRNRERRRGTQEREECVIYGRELSRERRRGTQEEEEECVIES